MRRVIAAANVAAAAGFLMSGLAAGGAMAAPRVAADIAPVHALAAQVMAGVGEPTLVVPPGASPHGYALRPSEAAGLEGAALVFWVGDALTPWLETAIGALAPQAVSVKLREAPGVMLLPVRDGATFAPHDDHAGERQTGAQADAPAHAADAHAHGEHTHAREATDEHLWLDPENAKAWLTAMAAALSTADPENADAYLVNAEAGRVALDALSAEIAAMLEPVKGRPFVVFHDAYQYFEARFGMSAAGAVAVGDAAQPSAARVAEIRAAVEHLGAACIFAEPQFSQGVIATVAEGTGARVGLLDPLGAGMPQGPGLYADVLRGMAASLADCLRSF